MLPGCGFIFSHYKDFLRHAKETYTFHTFEEYHEIRKNGRPSYPFILLRHDIDFRINRAIHFANVERELGVKATYFVRVHARYNPMSFRNYEILRQIIDAGHEVGLQVASVGPCNSSLTPFLVKAILR